MRNILFAASEGVPFIKTGGLADVVGSLPRDIDREYYDVRVIMPHVSGYEGPHGICYVLLYGL